MGGGRSGSASGGGPQAGPSRPGGTRHRYVRDGEVPVVHATLGRQATRPEAPVQQDKVLLDALRQDLERERSAREAAERALQETRASLVTVQTRLAHVEMDLQEAQHLQDRAQAAVEAAVEPAALLDEPVAAAPGPVRRRPRSERPARTPQPVKWWIKGEKA